MILGTSKMLSRYRPVDLLTITKILQKIQEIVGTSLENTMFSEYGNQNVRKCLKVYVPILKSWNSTFFQSGHLKIWELEHSKLEFVKWEIGNYKRKHRKFVFRFVCFLGISCFIKFRDDGYREIMKNSYIKSPNS